MVHALQIAKQMLLPGGFLINVHDLPVPHVIAVQTATTETLAGWLLEKEDFKTERSAYQALMEVVSVNLFALEDEQDFQFNVYVDELKELQDWLTQHWESACIPEITRHHIDELIQKDGQTTRMILKNPARMTKLKSL